MSFLDILLKAGSLSGLVSLLYLIYNNWRKKPKLIFHVKGSALDEFYKEGEQFCRFNYITAISNLSLTPNSVLNFWLIVFKNRKTNLTLRNGHGNLREIKDITNQDLLKLPLFFGPKESKDLELKFEFKVKGTADEKVIRIMEQIKDAHIPPALAGQTFYRHMYRYEVCIEDINGNIFDKDGNKVNREEMNLRWTLPNYQGDRQKGKKLPLIKHRLKIIRARLAFAFINLLSHVGLWR